MTRHRTSRRFASLTLGIGLAALFAGCSAGGGGGGAPPAGSTGGAAGASGASGATGATGSGPATTTPIRHVFLIVKENHTFDGYFATFPGANGATTATKSNGSQVRLAAPLTDLYFAGSNHFDNAHTDYHGGAMDQFDKGQLPPIPLIYPGAFVTWSGSSAISYYTEIATRGVLCDAFFTSIMGPSVPNHMHLLAATSGGAVSNPSIVGGTIDVLDASGQIVKHPQTFTRAEVPTTLPNELEAAGFSWAYYEEESLTNVFEGQGEGVKMFEVFHSLPSFASHHVDSQSHLDQSLSALLASGPVGNVTYVHPSAVNCEHPLIGSVSKGVDWTRKVVNQIAQSPYWSDCAIFITFDDYGGFYDHVPPPQVDALGLGFRVPCMIASPYARRGVVDHTQYEFSSIVRFCETTFGLPTMTARDAAANDMMGAFDFTQTPRPASDFIVP